MRCWTLIWNGERFSKYCPKVFLTTELGRRESLILNKASPMNREIRPNQEGWVTLLVKIPMIKIILFEVYLPVVPSCGSQLACDRLCVGNILFLLLRVCSVFLQTNCNKSFKVKSRQSKGVNIQIMGTTRLPKASDGYGSRAIIVPVNARINVLGRGRIAAKTPFNKTYYSTNNAMTEVKVIRRLKELHRKCVDSPNTIVNSRLYKLICDKDLLNIAYNKLKSKPGQMTPGISPVTLDGMSNEVLEAITASLKSETFQFSPGRRIQIPKGSGGTRPLTIAPPRDKLVQECMRIILEAIFEPTFLDCSHGFRPNRSCHTALKSIRSQFQPTVWVIEGDISQCFPSIDHQKLMEIIEEKILDRQFTKLIRKSLSAGYFEFKIFQHDIVGTPQGSIISPILSNIFLHQLDLYIMDLKEKFDKGKESRPTKEGNALRYQMNRAKARGDLLTVLKLSREAKTVPWADLSDPSFRKLSFVRYADDWVIGVKGTFKETVEILNLVRAKLDSWGLTLSESKTKLTNLNKSHIFFLGTKISRARQTTFARIGRSRLLKRNSRKLRLEAPLKEIVSKLHKTSFMKGGKSHPKYVWMTLEHRQIINLYNSVLRGYLNYYYYFAHNYSRLVSRLTYELKFSCAKLLAAKFSMKTMAKVFNKFGSQLTVTHVDDKGKKRIYNFHTPSYKSTLNFLINVNPIITSLFGSFSLAL